MPKLTHTNKNGGMTYFEILIVIGILLILTRSISPFYSNFILRMNTDIAADTIIGSIRKAQIYSMNSKYNTTWGICVTSSSIRIYTGTCALPTIKEDTPISSNITVNGLSAITFSKFRGEPTSALNIVVSSSIKSRTISLNIAGGVDIH